MLKIILRYFVVITILFSVNALAQSGMGGMGGQGPDFSDAAKELGITEEALLEALGGPPPDFAAAAEKLGVTEEKLREVIPGPPEGEPR